MDLQKIVESAPKEALVEMVVAHCRLDARFRAEVVQRFQSTADDEFQALQAMIEVTISENEDESGDLGWSGTELLAEDLREMLSAAGKRISTGDYDVALKMADFVLETLMTTHDVTWEVSDELEAVPFELAAVVQDLAEQLIADGGSGADWTEKLVNMAVSGGYEYGRDLLESVLPLADEASKELFYAAASKLKQNSVYIEDDFDRVLREQVDRQIYGDEAADGYMYANRDVDAFRRRLISGALARQEFAEAERLCQEPLETEKPLSLRSKADWQKELYKVYEQAGWRPKQEETALELVEAGYMDYYGSAKKLLSEAGKWEGIYPGLLRTLKEVLRPHQYMSWLASENEVDLMMDVLRQHPELVLEFGPQLRESHGEEVSAIAGARVRAEGERASSRSAYRELGLTLAKFAKIAGKEQAVSLLNEIRSAYPRKPALQDELKNAASRILSS